MVVVSKVLENRNSNNKEGIVVHKKVHRNNRMKKIINQVQELYKVDYQIVMVQLIVNRKNQEVLQ